MTKNRLEAFSDGVLAIIITIMILEIKVPESADWHVFVKMHTKFFSYILSFIYVGIYWNNHHHLLHAAKVINGKIMWANLILLFWISLLPFATGWMGESQFSQNPVIFYGLVLLCSAFAYLYLQTLIVRSEGCDSAFAKAIGRDYKGKVSLALYVAGIILVFASPYLSLTCYGMVSLLWLIPDKRIEDNL